VCVLGKISAANVIDNVTGERFTIKAKSFIFCGGPFTDELRALEADKQSMRV
jgi:glycerol-3-phosphate dehydrogenase